MGELYVLYGAVRDLVISYKVQCCKYAQETKEYTELYRGG